VQEEEEQEHSTVRPSKQRHMRLLIGFAVQNIVYSNQNNAKAIGAQRDQAQTAMSARGSTTKFETNATRWTMM
jgi:hypothetical protein